MAEQKKDKQTKPVSAKALKVAIGVALMVLGLAAVIYWWKDLINLIQGAVGLFLIMAGAVAIIIAKN
ncbi:MAG: hypothetical protein KKH25_05315 [Candidatus Omnitrophica bacterium]|nr:hypothetical protein [Candidatus Omnitrophota bacterium]